MTFLDEDFLLHSKSSKILFHDYAKDMPIYDFHCHLNPKEIADNKRYESMTELWLEGDHYKWRAMRAFGIDESLITGKASDKEKFREWIKTLSYMIGNPLYHWSHLELKRYFGYSKAVKEEDWEDIWNHCTEVLSGDAFSTQSIISSSCVKVICTTDDPCDSLVSHIQIANNPSIETKVLPAFRPDKGLEIKQSAFLPFVRKLEAAAQVTIQSYEQYLECLEKRVHFFHETGCRISDHGFEKLVYEPGTKQEAASTFEKALSGQTISSVEADQFKTYTFVFLCELYYSLGWAMQLHIGAIRNNNTRKFAQLGADSGFDSISDHGLAKPLNLFLDALDQKNCLPKTIIYPLNPNHFELVASTAGNFQGDGIRGKIQFGSGWWYNDQKGGMLKQMTDLANIGLLNTFIGMLTDSRSFLSYTRHEYFRRILCQLVGTWIEDGEIPADYKLIGGIIQDISFHNAKHYFDIPLD
ncbi:glucuronate isomerase [Metabacillus sp. RGM 3146]|uniref:glucuronate isomerase n=1 Tax=Metabacillus sp. RGM 3146 TaxID=3401092 RepID=UPI003B9A74D0